MYQGAYRTERKYQGRKIIIDLACIPPPLGNGLEVMVMYSTGKEIASERHSALPEAEEAYRRMLERYPEDAKETEGRRCVKNSSCA